MGKLFQLCVVGVIMVCAPSCGNISGTDDVNVEGVGYRETQNGLWGILNPKTGKPIYEDEFNNKPSLVINGYFWVENAGESGKYALYKVEENAPELIAGGLLGVGFFSDGLIPTVTRDSHITMLNGKGEVAFTLDSYKGKEITRSALIYSDGLLPVQCDEQWGAVDTNGEMVIEPIYTWISDFRSNRSIALKKMESENNSAPTYKWVIIDTKGSIIKDLECVYLENNPCKISDGVWLLYTNEDKRFVDLQTGEILCKVNSDEDIRCFNSKYYVSETDGQMRVKNYKKKRIVKGDYSDLALFSDDMFYAQKSENKGYWLNLEGERIGTLEDWNNMNYYDEYGIRTVYVDGSEVLLNEKGEIISDEYQSIDFQTRSEPLYSDYFDADEELTNLLNPLKSGGYNDVILGMTAIEVAEKYPNEMDASYSFYTQVCDNVNVIFDGYYKTARYVTKTRDGYWGKETYQEQDGYEFTDVRVSEIEISHYYVGSEYVYRLRDMFEKIDNHMKERGLRLGVCGDDIKCFESDKYVIKVSIERLYDSVYFLRMCVSGVSEG